MPFITTAERIGMEKGMEKGAYKTRKEDIVKLYKRANMQPENIADILEVEIDFVKSVLKEEGVYSLQ